MRAPRLPRCGVCDSTGVVLHCQQCDEPTCPDHIHRLFVCEELPAQYLCTACVEDRAGDLATLPALRDQLTVPA